MRLRDQLGEGAFMPLADHPLRRRWTDPRWNLLADADLAQIQPLSLSGTKELWEKIAPMIGDTDPLSTQFFESIEEFNAEGEAAVGRRWLFDHIPTGVAELFVCWVDLGVPGLLMPAKVFCQYWDDFCYPSSDNVVAWSVNDDWVACYHHSERLWVGRRRR